MIESTKGMFAEQPLGVAPPSPKVLARVAGALYLVVALAGGFAEGFADPKIFVAGDAAATTGIVSANVGLVRLDVVAHLVDAVFLVLTAATLYVLLKHVGKHAGRLMVMAVMLAAGLKAVSAVFTIVALQVATDPSYARAFGAGGGHALVLLLLQTEHYGIFAAQVFFGLWLAPLGYLAYRSRLFPKALGIILGAATGSYLVDVITVVLLPDLSAQIHGFLTIVPTIAEIWMLLYLLAIGVRTHREARPPAAESAPLLPNAASAAEV